MSDNELPDLLPWDFAPEVVLMPEVILRHQADLIKQKSGGRLTAEVEFNDADEFSNFGFVVIAPSLNYSVRLFSGWHTIGLPYPATVKSEDSTMGKRANDEKEFRELVLNALGDNYARSVFQSLLARVGDASAKANKPNVDEHKTSSN